MILWLVIMLATLNKHGIAKCLLAGAQAAGVQIYLDCNNAVQVLAKEEMLQRWNTVLFYHRVEIKALLQVRQMLATCSRQARQLD